MTDLPSARPVILGIYKAYYVELLEKLTGNIIFVPTDLVYRLFHENKKKVMRTMYPKYTSLLSYFNSYNYNIYNVHITFVIMLRCP